MLGVLAMVPVKAFPAISSHGWTVTDIVEISEITDIAVSAVDRRIAFIVKHPSVESGTVNYGLYEVNPETPETVFKLVESPYLADLSPHPNGRRWTVRAEFGAGVQLYDIASDGQSYPLVVNTQTAPIGGNDGVITDSEEAARDTGVLSYEWSPRGPLLWYSRLRLRTVNDQKALDDQGIVYDDRNPTSFAHPNVMLMGTELHVLDTRSMSDRTLAFVPSNAITDQTVFRRQGSTTSWTADSRHIDYRVDENKSGERKITFWTLDVARGIAARMPGAEPLESFFTVPSKDGTLSFMVKAQGSEHRLIQIGRNGKVVTDFGTVAFSRIESVWRARRNGRLVLGVRYPDRDGLVTLPGSQAGRVLERVFDDLSECAFDPDLTHGACVRQSLTLPPELVTVSLSNGRVATLVRPNSRYDSIKPLLSERADWVNRFGSRSTGYITYPRGYAQGKRYPVIAISHGIDARNKFAYHGFQWEFPAQVFAEHGYLLLSVNDPALTPRTRAAWNANIGGTSAVSIDDMQFAVGFNAVAGMEAALQSVIDKGIADPEKTGIAGYSRGSIVARFVMAQSKLFKVGSSADSGLYNAGDYWLAGSAYIRNLYDALYGGTPFDSSAFDNYQRFSPSVRASDFAGPLLQQFAAASSASGLELNELLRAAHVPTELVFYPRESHIFHEPRHRAAAMNLNLDWFNYWLLGERDPDPKKSERYARWDEFALFWRRQ